MPTLPSTSGFSGTLADLAADLRRGVSCLVVADKGWTQIIVRDLRERLREHELAWEYLDGRPSAEAKPTDDVGIMLLTIAQLRRVVRSRESVGVVVLPHLDVMTVADAGWTNIAREVVPLLYENVTLVLLGFCDPTIHLLPLAEKLFQRKYRIEQPFREVVPDPAAAEQLPAGFSTVPEPPPT